METPSRALRNLHLNKIQEISTPLKIPASPFMKSLGYGTGVNVYRLDRSPKPNGQIQSPWAVKRVSQRTRLNGEKIFNHRIQEEAEILRKLNHPNIVGFRAITKSKDGVDTLALECCNNSLGSILEEHQEEDLGPLAAWQTLKMIVDISKALDYLHTEAKLLHGDLKSHNILVKGCFEICKLCDFGVSLPLDEKGQIDFIKNPNLKYVGTNLWSAPEIMEEEDIIDCKADIFSFGLVIYETLALVPPHFFNETVNEEQENKSNNDSSVICLDDVSTASKQTANSSSFIEDDEDQDSFLKNIDAACGTRPALPQKFIMLDEYVQVIELFYLCTNSEPEDRPSAKQIWKELEIQSKTTHKDNDSQSN